MLAFTPGIHVQLAASTVGPVQDDQGTLGLEATVELADVPRADVVVVPGGPGTVEALAGPLPEWLRLVHTHTRWTTSVCSGSIILAAAPAGAGIGGLLGSRFGLTAPLWFAAALLLLTALIAARWANETAINAALADQDHLDATKLRS